MRFSVLCKCLVKDIANKKHESIFLHFFEFSAHMTVFLVEKSDSVDPKVMPLSSMCVGAGCVGKLPAAVTWFSPSEEE